MHAASEDPHTEILVALAHLQNVVERLAGSKTISKQRTKPRSVFRVVTKYTPLARPDSDAKWQSKDPDFVRAFLDAFSDHPETFKIRCRTNLADTELSVKLLVMTVTKQLSPPDLVAGQRTHYSLAMTDLFARLVEFGDAIKKDDPTLSSARMELQKTHETPGWMARETRGSGLVLNELGERLLLPAAIERVKQLLAEGSSDVAADATDKDTHLDTPTDAVE
jgi:hypothetical protein